MILKENQFTVNLFCFSLINTLNSQTDRCCKNSSVKQTAVSRSKRQVCFHRQHVDNYFLNTKTMIIIKKRKSLTLNPTMKNRRFSHCRSCPFLGTSFFSWQKKKNTFELNNRLIYQFNLQIKTCCTLKWNSFMVLTSTPHKKGSRIQTCNLLRGRKAFLK